MKTKQFLKKTPDEWSGVPVSEFGPTKEAKMARILDMIWSDTAFKEEIMENPAEILRREGIEVPDNMKVILIEDEKNEFNFAIPNIPPKEEFYYRYEQISGWWMFAHQLWYWMGRQLDLEKSRPFREGLTIQLIGKTWNDSEYRELMINDPKAAFEQQGLEFPKKLKIKSLVNSENTFYLPIPKAPKEVKWNKKGKTGSWFVNGHTLWWWLVSPRLMANDIGTVSGLVG